ncbi:COG1470 family protein [Cellulomonas xiejunii]|uniref:COG1470 family protein n=1 Tax=Cellulomonas xiejunii TaxID=2968083 RepID=UPI001D0DD19E|nr:DUF916 domain-containing protein [Cellulomonas xiejunii]MCC2313428.1 DUF916 domain-containing protein [Cellulomonas xiejunii]
MRILGRAVVVAVLGVLVVAPAAGAAPGPVRGGTAVAGTSDDGAPQEPGAGTPGGTVTWTVQPATAEGPDGRISLRHVLDPGASVTEHVAITNFSDGPATFAVYAGDGVVSDSGHFDLPPGDGAPRDGGAWITLGDAPGAERVDDRSLRLTLEPGAAVTVPLTVTVPADATPGDHPAGVVAELVAGDTVRLAARVGTRLHLRVAGDVAASLAPQDVTTRWEPSWNPFAPGTVHVRYRVANTGDVRLAARAATTLAGPFGVAEAEHSTQIREVLPGQSALVEAELRVWPLVRVTGHVDARPWVVGEDVVDAALRGGSADVSVWAVPWSQLALLVLVVGGVLLVRWRRRRTAQQVQARVDEALAAAGVTHEPASATGATGTAS